MAHLRCKLCGQDLDRSARLLGEEVVKDLHRMVHLRGWISKASGYLETQVDSQAAILLSEIRDLCEDNAYICI